MGAEVKHSPRVRGTMTGTDATMLAISIKHALKHLRNGRPDTALAVLEDAQEIIDARSAHTSAEREKS